MWLPFVLNWRRGSESNRCIKVLQTFALPLGYRASRESLLAKYLGFDRQVKLGGSSGACRELPSSRNGSRSRREGRSHHAAALAQSDSPRAGGFAPPAQDHFVA